MENEGKSTGNAGFSFNPVGANKNPDNNKDVIKDINVGDNKDTVKETTIQENINIKLNAEYTDKRSVSIALVRNYSLYRRANDKSLNKKQDYIGSSLTSSRILSSNDEEVKAYFPNIIGLSPTNENFIHRVKQYLNNIQIPVNELGVTFNTSFYYKTYSGYLEIKKQEDAIEEKYRLANKNTPKAMKDALQEKITNLNALESTKHKYGNPINLDDYLMYRHCLLYKDIAKDTAIINSDNSIRFYFKDDNKEADLQKKLRLEINKAKANYVDMITDDDLFNAVYIQYCVYSGKPVISSMLEDRIIKENQLDRFSVDEPIKFNKIFNDRDIKIKSIIETLISRGELIRSTYNQNIQTAEGELIGANIGEAVAWFKNTENANVVTAYTNRLKAI